MGHELERLAEMHDEIELEVIEIVSKDVKRAWKNGIRSFPAIRINNDILAGLTLDREKIDDFVTNHLET